MGKRAGAGRKSLESKLGEPVVELTIRITKSQHKFVTGQGIAAAEYIRALIDAAMRAGQGDSQGGKRPPH